MAQSNDTTLASRLTDLALVSNKPVDPEVAPVQQSHSTETLAQSLDVVADVDTLELATSVVDTVSFDSVGGSTKLIVRNGNGENVAFVVSAATMMRACRPWKCILDDSFAAARPDRPKILEFVEDDYDSLKILIHIVHFQFSQVPTSLTIAGLHRMAILTDKYFATSLVCPWIPRWVEAVEETVDGPSAPLWLWIAWEYGLLEIFGRVSDALSMGISLMPLLEISRGDAAHVGNNEHEMWYDDQLLTSDYFPPGVSDMILKERTKFIGLLIDPIYDYLERLLSAVAFVDKPGTFWHTLCPCSNKRSDCLSLQAGCLVASLTALNLWPRRSVSEIIMSPQDLAEELLHIKVSHCYDNDFYKAASRLTVKSACGSFSGIVANIRKIEENSHCEIDSEQRSYMTKQRSIWDRSFISYYPEENLAPGLPS